MKNDAAGTGIGTRTSAGAGAGSGKVHRMPVDEDLEFALDEGVRKYDPAGFIIPGQDTQGHSERVYCRVQPSVMRQLEMVLKGKKFPFRTVGDIYRWCIWRGLRTLDKMEPAGNTYLARAEAVTLILRQEMYMQEYMHMFGQLEKTTAAHISMGAIGEARRTVAQVKAEFIKIEEPYWRKKCLDELTSRFGHLMKGNQAVGLTGGGGGGESEGEGEVEDAE
jgi:hypothetical protein